MSEHKAGNSAFDKDAYWKKRSEGKRGQGASIATVATRSHLSRSKQSTRRANLRQQWRAYNRQLRKASGRGE